MSLFLLHTHEGPNFFPHGIDKFHWNMMHIHPSLLSLIERFYSCTKLKYFTSLIGSPNDIMTGNSNIVADLQRIIDVQQDTTLFLAQSFLSR